MIFRRNSRAKISESHCNRLLKFTLLFHDFGPKSVILLRERLRNSRFFSAIFFYVTCWWNCNVFPLLFEEIRDFIPPMFDEFFSITDCQNLRFLLQLTIKITNFCNHLPKYENFLQNHFPKLTVSSDISCRNSWFYSVIVCLN